MENQNGIRKEVNADQIMVSRVYTGNYQKTGTQTAELKQKVVTTSYYPAIQVSNSHQDNIYGNADFGAAAQETPYENTETRVAWIDVPTGASMEQVAAKLATFENANLYKVLSNQPILTSSQVAGIAADLTSKNAIAESQVVRYPDDHPDSPGQLILDPNGKPQYRSVFFSVEGKADQDTRDADPENIYLTPAIAMEYAPAESANVVEGQAIQI